MSEPIDACSDGAPPEATAVARVATQGAEPWAAKCPRITPPALAQSLAGCVALGRWAACRALYLPDRGWVSSSVRLVLRVRGAAAVKPFAGELIDWLNSK